jgi:fructose-1,6-bisphosphatase I
MSVVPGEIHQRTPFVVGSKDDVALAESFIQDHSRRQGTLLTNES